MNMLVQFAPWIAFSLVSGIDWRLGLAVGMISQIILILAVHPRRVGVLNGAMLAFFLVVGVLAVLRPDSSVQDHVDIISTAWLAIVAAVSLVVGHPFTLDFSATRSRPRSPGRHGSCRSTARSPASGRRASPAWPLPV